MENQPIFTGRDINTGAISLLRATGQTLLTTAGTLDNLTDVVITSATDNQVLKYTSPNWINSRLEFTDINAVDLITPLATGQYLRYNGLVWRNNSRDYITINMYGTTQTTLHANTTPKPIMAGIAAYWSTIPNPATNTNGNMTSRTTPFSSVFDTSTGFITLNGNKEYMITATINQGGVNLNSSTQTQLSIYNASSGTAVAFTPQNFTNIGRADTDFSGMGISTSAVVGTGITKIAVMFNYLTAQTTGLNPLDTSITVSIIEL